MRACTLALLGTGGTTSKRRRTGPTFAPRSITSSDSVICAARHARLRVRSSGRDGAEHRDDFAGRLARALDRLGLAHAAKHRELLARLRCRRALAQQQGTTWLPSASSICSSTAPAT